jgi:hypothetical protein
MPLNSPCLALLTCGLLIIPVGCSPSKSGGDGLLIPSASGGHGGQAGHGGQPSPDGAVAVNDAGNGGVPGAGGGGTGGAAGEGGQGGGGGQAGMSGTGGSAGSGGDTPPGEELTFCQERCSVDGDCLADHTCQSGICWPDSTPSTSCSSDSECVGLFSGWSTACATSDDCAGFAAGTQDCADVSGEGRCVFIPGPNLACATLQQEEVDVTRFPGGEALTVCAQTRATCVDGACQLPCTDNSHCASPEYPVCDLGVGRCVCQPDSCVTNASVCGDDGICKCTGDADCRAGSVDTCIEGVCGCSNATICPDTTSHPGTEWVCEAWEG